MKRTLLLSSFLFSCVACSSESTSTSSGAAGSSGASATTSSGGATGAGGAGGAGGSSSTGGTGGSSPDAGGPPLFGNVAVDLITDDHTGFLAIFFDGPQPESAALEVRQSIG